MSTKGDILQAIATRLEKLKSSNGYSLDVKKVYYDKIPMGLDLNSYQLPVLFILEGQDQITMQHKCVIGNWNVRLQLWANVDVGDLTMNNYIRDVFKCLYADSFDAQREDAFRGLHTSLVQITPLSIDSDLNMIKANRIYEVNLSVEYRSKLFSL